MDAVIESYIKEEKEEKGEQDAQRVKLMRLCLLRELRGGFQPITGQEPLHAHLKLT